MWVSALSALRFAAGLPPEFGHLVTDLVLFASGRRTAAGSNATTAATVEAVHRFLDVSRGSRWYAYSPTPFCFSPAGCMPAAIYNDPVASLLDKAGRLRFFARELGEILTSRFGTETGAVPPPSDIPADAQVTDLQARIDSLVIEAQFLFASGNVGDLVRAQRLLSDVHRLLALLLFIVQRRGAAIARSAGGSVA